MLIDWFTVVAQIVNFLVLVWLLKRFFYQPILNALDARERRIAAELAGAEAKKSEAERERAEFQHKNNEFDRQRAALLSKASDEAQAERQRLLAAAWKDFSDLRTKRQDALKREYQSMSEALARQICLEVFAIARKVLVDLADANLEAHIVEAFLKRMRQSSDEEKAQLASALRFASVSAASNATVSSRVTSTAVVADEEVMVNSSFDLSTDQQSAIEAVLNEHLGMKHSVRFATRPDIVSGIELVTNGYKVEWTIGSHLVSLEREVEQLLENQSGCDTEPESETESDVQPSNDENAN